MSFSSWFSRLHNSSKKPKYNNLWHSFFIKHKPQQSHMIIVEEVLMNSEQNNKLQNALKSSSVSWLTSLLPMALALSAAGSFALQSQNTPSLCDSSNLHDQQCVFNYFNFLNFFRRLLVFF